MAPRLPSLGRERESCKTPRTVTFPENNSSATKNSEHSTKRHNSIFSSKSKKLFKTTSDRTQQPKKSRFEIATEILAEEKAARLLQSLKQEEEKLFWRKRNEQARQRYYGVTNGRPRYGWESPHANSTKAESSSKFGNLRGLGRSQSLSVKSSQQVANSPSPSTREVWNTLYAKNQEIHSLRLSHQEMLEELHSHQIGLRSHKRALNEARWESEECYQTLSLLSRLAGEGKRFDEKIWAERIQLRNNLKKLEVEKEELSVKWEQCRQMLDSVDAIWFKEWEEKEVLIHELRDARAENKRLNVQLTGLYRGAGRDEPDAQSERRDSSIDGEFYDAPERPGQTGSENDSQLCSPVNVAAEGPHVPPRVSSVHWQNLARSASARREQFETEERLKSTTETGSKRSLEGPRADFEADRMSPQPDQVWWTQLYGWPHCTNVMTV